MNIVQANWSPFLLFNIECNRIIFVASEKSFPHHAPERMSCCRLLREIVSLQWCNPSSKTNWILKRFVCLKQIWSDLWIELLITDTNRVQLVLFGWWLIVRKITYVLVSQAVREERMAYAVMWCDGDDDVPTNQDESYDVDDSILLSIHYQLIPHLTVTSSSK